MQGWTLQGWTTAGGPLPSPCPSQRGQVLKRGGRVPPPCLCSGLELRMGPAPYGKARGLGWGSQAPAFPPPEGLRIMCEGAGPLRGAGHSEQLVQQRSPSCLRARM